MKLGRVPESLNSFRTAIRLYKMMDSIEGDRLLQSLSEMGFEILIGTEPIGNIKSIIMIAPYASLLYTLV